MVAWVFFEYLRNKRLGSLRSQLFDQQVDADDRQFFSAARAVGAMALRPFGFDVGVDAYGCHDELAKSE
jgi:hypothetical protein